MPADHSITSISVCRLRIPGSGNAERLDVILRPLLWCNSITFPTSFLLLLFETLYKYVHSFSFK